jgi:hypothetical protein
MHETHLATLARNSFLLFGLVFFQVFSATFPEKKVGGDNLAVKFETQPVDPRQGDQIRRICAH